MRPIYIYEYWIKSSSHCELYRVDLWPPRCHATRGQTDTRSRSERIMKQVDGWSRGASSHAKLTRDEITCEVWEDSRLIKSCSKEKKAKSARFRCWMQKSSISQPQAQVRISLSIWTSFQDNNESYWLKLIWQLSTFLFTRLRFRSQVEFELGLKSKDPSNSEKLRQTAFNSVSY